MRNNVIKKIITLTIIGIFTISAMEPEENPAKSNCEIQQTPAQEFYPIIALPISGTYFAKLPRELLGQLSLIFIIKYAAFKWSDHLEVSLFEQETVEQEIQNYKLYAYEILLKYDRLSKYIKYFLSELNSWDAAEKTIAPILCFLTKDEFERISDIFKRSKMGKMLAHGILSADIQNDPLHKLIELAKTKNKSLIELSPQDFLSENDHSMAFNQNEPSILTDEIAMQLANFFYTH